MSTASVINQNDFLNVGITIGQVLLALFTVIPKPQLSAVVIV
ncbi:conserved hypothetical protein [Vibrio cholerae MO10]|uniref:Uncharacterized protein n=3 Tax=Vibrio TaxID=662 RepID=Q9KLJ4_VIBCH|nr:hypothetical protein VC_A0750 [Vibrio cholerae O1 biovar El Tor str. N16961]AKN37205.1 hypothetical protein [Vibrio splendidus]EET24030.1 conserved hypothetical protein [Vibrio cholerae MO10]